MGSESNGASSDYFGEYPQALAARLMGWAVAMFTLLPMFTEHEIPN